MSELGRRKEIIDLKNDHAKIRIVINIILMTILINELFTSVKRSMKTPNGKTLIRW